MSRKSHRIKKNKSKEQREYDDLHLKKIFYNNSIDTDKFKIIRSENDNACLYKSLANGLILKYNYKENPEDLSMKIQQQCYEWIVENCDKITSSGETIADLVAREHFNNNDETEECFELYKSWYKYYAAMDISEILEIDSELDIENEIERWGGIPELFAFGEIYEYNVKVYMPKIYNANTKRLNQGRIITKNNELIPCKNVKYILSYENTTINDKEINLLYRSGSLEHYDLLI